MTSGPHTCVAGAEQRKLESFSWLTAPTLPSTFFNEYFQRKPLLIERDDAVYYGDLLTTDRLDEHLTHHGLSYPDVAMVAGGEKLEQGAYCYPSGLVDAIRLSQQYADGATVVVMQLNRWDARLAQLCRSLEADLSYRFQANIYLTPPGAKGFRSHYDRHDVFVLQLAGTKHWRLFDTPVDLPRREQGFDASLVRDAPCTAEFDMHPGDALYVPRGTMHEAVSHDNESLHVTLGMMHPTWGDLLSKALERASLRDPQLREALPFGYATPGFDRTQGRAEFSRLLARAILNADFDDALDQFVDDVVCNSHPLLLGQLRQMRAITQLEPSTRVGPRPHLLYSLELVEGNVVLSCYGNELVMPAQAEPMLRFVLTTPTYTIGEIPVDLPDEAKLDIVQGLVRGGILQVIAAR
jgi:ribosomal protein L16 Arg81 hydroxylase